MKEEKVFGYEKADESPGFLLWQVSNLWQRELKKALTKFDLTHTQFVLLASLYWLSQRQEVTQVALSEHAKTDKMMTSKVLRTLEAKKLVQRREHQTDTRAKEVEITPQGLSILKEAVNVVEAFDRYFFSPASEGNQSFIQQMNALLLPRKPTDEVA